ncbi:MAG TPA: RagB/SusD family nutrient uptake outer membrane protein, partial [Chitinophagaceae bacterium]|nr:RagB/SusD family nutrient uptake outer membrane protein [Chitinophagaceae bacterium]
MKTSYLYRSIVCVAALAIGFASCKRYLEVEPISSFGSDYVFDNVVNAQKAVLGAYAPLTGDQGYGIRISMYYPYDEDNMMGQGGTPYPDNERRDIAHYNAKPSNTQLAAPFNQLYSGIERANICIYNIPRMEKYAAGTEAEKKELRRLHGEVLVLRAQYYLELIRNWGDVPAQFLPSSLETDLFKPKMDRDSIYNVLLDDLATAAGLLPWRTEVAADERITQGAARALRARIALYRGGYSLRRNRKMERGSNHKTYYQIARDECDAIMKRPDQHKLNPSYMSVFKDYICAHRIEPNGEVIWEVAMGGGTSALGDSKMGYYNGPRWNNLGNSALTILPNYFYMFDSTDTRRDVTVAPYNVNQNGTLAGRTLQTLVDGKFRRDWITNPVMLTSNAQYFGLNWPMIRFSDVLLMFAEAENELNNGPTAAAKAAFEQVRLRAFGGDASLIGTTPSTYQEFFDAIVKERALEFGSEGIRKYDLIRWNLLKTKLDETKALLAVMAARSAAPWNTYPTTMYFRTGQTTMQWAGSFYKPTVTPAPSGYTSVAWLGNGITSTILTYYAVGFQ